MPRGSPHLYSPHETVIYRRNSVYDIDLNCDSSDALVDIKILKRTGPTPSALWIFLDEFKRRSYELRMKAPSFLTLDDDIERHCTL